MSALWFLWQRLVLPVVVCGFCLLLTILPVSATALYEIPTVSAGVPTWIVDKAQILSISSKTAIGGTLEKLAKETGYEVRFVTIHRFDYGDTAETLAQKIFQKWYPSAESQAKQTLVLLDNVTNTTAIVTGTDVKSLLSDEIATSVAQETMLVPLQDGNKYNESFGNAANRLSLVLTGKPDPGAPVVRESKGVERTYLTAEETEEGRVNYTLIVSILLLAATAIPMVTYYWYQRD
jgi:uncharacterized protein